MTDVHTLRVARPSDDIEALLPFYRDGLGLDVLVHFEDHAGFDGVMLGRKSVPYHLEFTRARGHKAGRAPTQDNLLVFYVPDRTEWEAAVARMRQAGFAPVPAFNPYWVRTALPSRIQTATASCCRTPLGTRKIGARSRRSARRKIFPRRRQKETLLLGSNCYVLAGICSEFEPLTLAVDLTSASPTSTPKGQTIPFKQAILVALAAGLGYGFDSYAVNIFGMLSPLIRKDLGVSIATIGRIGSIFLVGYTLGTIGFGYLADTLGRRNALRFSIFLYGTTTVLGGATSSVAATAILRFLTGVGGAGELAVGAPYTAEVWPKNLRALGTGGIMFSLFAVGFILAAMVALLLVPTYGWRAAFFFAAIPAALLFWFRTLVAESPRFAEVQDALAKAEKAAASDTTRRPRENIWAIPGAKKRIVIGWLLYVANACGYWGITFFLTTFMIQKFHLSSPEAIFWAMIFYIAQAVLSLVGTILSDVIGRRPAGIGGALIMIGGTIAATTTSSFATFAVFGALMIGMLGWLWGIGDTYLSEFFRTSLRGTAFGIMVGGGRLVSIAAPSLVGWGISVYGPTIPFLATAGLWVLTIIGYWIGPETARKDLEAVQL